MKKMTCPECGKGIIEPLAVAGRRSPFRNIPDLEIPASVSIPTCNRCGEEWYDGKTTEVLQEALQSAYQEALVRKAAAAVESLKEHFTQQDLERRLGLSAGYLSKIKGGKDVSSPLVALLVLLAHEPGRIGELHGLLKVIPDSAPQFRLRVETRLLGPKGSAAVKNRIPSHARVDLAPPVWKAPA